MAFFKTLKDQIETLPELKDKFQRALKYAGPQKKQIIVILILTLFVAAVGAFEPLIMKYIFDSLAGDSIFRDIAIGVFLLAFTVLFKETFNGISNYFAFLRTHFFRYSTHRIFWETSRKQLIWIM